MDRLEPVWIKLLWTFTALCVDVFIHTEEWNCRVTWSHDKLFKNCQKSFPKWLFHFLFTPVMCEIRLLHLLANKWYYQSFKILLFWCMRSGILLWFMFHCLPVRLTVSSCTVFSELFAHFYWIIIFSLICKNSLFWTQKFCQI